jgi:DNA polymerase/3'-5' exonuclease PolX
MELKEAERIAGEIVEVLKEACSQIEVAGSIRRRRPFVHDIDIVCIPANQGQFLLAVKSLGRSKRGGPKMICLDVAGVSVDIYLATEDTWPTLLLIRTGSKEHNVKLCARAATLRMRLHANGSGLEDGNGILKPRDEADLFRMLSLPYKRPEDRN